MSMWTEGLSRENYVDNQSHHDDDMITSKADDAALSDNHEDGSISSISDDAVLSAVKPSFDPVAFNGNVKLLL